MRIFESSDFLTSLDKTDFLGHGSYASVRRCFHNKLKNVVVKCIGLTGSDETISSTKSNIDREAQVLFSLKHKNIIQFHGVTSWNSCYGLVMEEATGYNLEDLFIHEKNIKDISWLLRRRIFHDIASGLDYLHNNFFDRSYIHGDLKLQNILLNEDLIAKIADFGAVSIAMASGAFSGSLEIEPSKQFNPLYSPPELLNNYLMEKTCKMDVYSFGMIGYEIINCHQIFQGLNISSIQMITNLIKNEGLKPDEKIFDETKKSLHNKIDLQVFCNLKKIVTDCWKTNAKDRPSIEKIKKELENFNVDGVFEIEYLKKPKRNIYIERVPLNEYGPPFQTISRKKVVSSSSWAEIKRRNSFPNKLSVIYIILIIKAKKS